MCVMLEIRIIFLDWAHCPFSNTLVRKELFWHNNVYAVSQSNAHNLNKEWHSYFSTRESTENRQLFHSFKARSSWVWMHLCIVMSWLITSRFNTLILPSERNDLVIQRTSIKKTRTNIVRAVWVCNANHLNKRVTLIFDHEAAHRTYCTVQPYFHSLKTKSSWPMHRVDFNITDVI